MRKKCHLTPLSLRTRDEGTRDEDDEDASLTASQGLPDVSPRVLEDAPETQTWFARGPALEHDPYLASGLAYLWEKGAQLCFQAALEGVCDAPYMTPYRSHTVRAGWFTFYSVVRFMLNALGVTEDSVRIAESALFKGIAAFDIAMSSPRGRTFMRDGYGAFVAPCATVLDYDWVWEAPEDLPPLRSPERLRYQRRLLQLLMGGVLHGSRMDLLDEIHDSTLAMVVTSSDYAAQFAGVQDALEPIPYTAVAYEKPHHVTRRSKHGAATAKLVERTPAWFAAEHVMVPSVSGQLPTLWDFASALMCTYELASQGTERLWRSATEAATAHLMTQHSYAFPLWLVGANVVDFAVDAVTIPTDKLPAWTAFREHLACIEPELWQRLRTLRSYYRRTVESLNLDHHSIGGWHHYLS